MIEAELAYAFTAGMVAAVNPCGFAMLPAYLSYFLGLEGAEAGTHGSMRRALAVSGMLMAGFMVVFGIIGLVISHIGDSFMHQMPWVTMFIGLALVVLGLAMAIRGYQINLRLPKIKTGKIGSDLWSVFVFGISYAVASLSCTIWVFLPLMTRSFRSANLLSGISVFVMFSLGMGVLLGGVTLALAGARTALVTRLKSAMPYVNRIAGVIIVLAGAYLAYYGWWERGLFTDAASQPTSGPVSFMFDASAKMADWINDFGAARIAIVVATLAAIVALVVAGLRKPAPKRPAPKQPAEV